MAELPASFGKYFLCDKIAAGGMAEIYLAKLLGPGGFEKQLVIKQISPALSKETAFVELFVAEAKTLVSLSHGNIVPVYELGVVDHTYFIAMEYVDGPTLGELMTALERRGEWLAPPVAAHVAAELSKGLDYAHRKGNGVVHRDLSPRNVLLSRDGEVKLVDFGLALPSDAARRAHTDSAGGDEGSGILPAGSFPYMSPEQVRLEPLDGRSDVFSLGVLLWEMLTGRRLFAREGVDETLSAVLGEPIPAPSAVRPGVPAELDRVCMRALARAREERTQSAGDVLSALSRFAYSIEPPVTQATLAELVARSCPPVAHTGAGEGETDAEASESEAEASEPADARPVPEQTRPMARASGRMRAATARTFATSESFGQVLANATPLMPFAAMTDSAARALARVAPGVTAATSPEPAPARRRGMRWAAIGVGVAALAAAALWVREPRPESAAVSAAESAEVGAAPAPSAAATEPRVAETRVAQAGAQAGEPAAEKQPAALHQPAAAEAGEPAAEQQPAAVQQPAAAQAGNPAQARDPSPEPAAKPAAKPGQEPAAAVTPVSNPRGEPAPTATARAAEPRRPRGQGTLQVGANPWADVFVDGAHLGQAPGAWPIPAGPHAVELRYRDQRRTFRVTVDPGETEALGLVDFTLR
jgi:tRNA A-37 threonylcarbamoyl transferase component Bud32